MVNPGYVYMDILVFTSMNDGVHYYHAMNLKLTLSNSSAKVDEDSSLGALDVIVNEYTFSEQATTSLLCKCKI